MGLELCSCTSGLQYPGGPHELSEHPVLPVPILALEDFNALIPRALSETLKRRGMNKAKSHRISHPSPKKKNPSGCPPSQPVPQSMLIALPAARSNFNAPNKRHGSRCTLQRGRSPKLRTFYSAVLSPPAFPPEPSAPAPAADGSRSAALTWLCRLIHSFIHSLPPRRGGCAAGMREGSEGGMRRHSEQSPPCRSSSQRRGHAERPHGGSELVKPC